MLLFRGANKEIKNYNSQSPFQVKKQTKNNKNECLLFLLLITVYKNIKKPTPTHPNNNKKAPSSYFSVVWFVDSSLHGCGAKELGYVSRTGLG